MAKIAFKGFLLLSVKPDDFKGASLFACAATRALLLVDLHRPEQIFNVDCRFRASVKAGGIRTLMANPGNKRPFEGV
jgi:hypothetical protein